MGVLNFSPNLQLSLYKMAKCEICNELEMKYTCPKCGVKYCSLKCFKSEIHKSMDESKLEKIDIKPESIEQNQENEIENAIETENNTKIEDTMIDSLIKDDKFKYYMKSPPLQLHILSIIEILNNISLTNEYSSDGRREIASKKINNLRLGGLESNEWVNEFFEWLTEWINEWNNNNNNNK